MVDKITKLCYIYLMIRYVWLIFLIILLGCDSTPPDTEDTSLDNPPSNVPEYYGIWRTEEKDGIVKEIEITKNMFIEKIYSNEILQNEKRRTYTYRSFVPPSIPNIIEIPHGKWVGQFNLLYYEPLGIKFSVQPNELTLGGGDIKYRGNNNTLEGKWICNTGYYNIIIQFVPFDYDSTHGTIMIEYTMDGHEGWYGFNGYYSIKNNNILNIRGIETDIFDINRVQKWFQLINDGKILKITNNSFSNEEITIYNETFGKDIQVEMFGFRSFISNTELQHDDSIYDFFSEEYYKK